MKLKRTYSTGSASSKKISRKRIVVDMTGKILGRTASKIAAMLIGKDKTTFSTNLDQGDTIVVINAGKFRVTGRKMEQKEYDNYSGFPGGRKVRTMAEMLEKNPTQVLRVAVSGMLPKNKLRQDRLARLHIYADNGPELSDTNTQ